MTWFLLFLAVSTAVATFSAFWCGVSLAVLTGASARARVDRIDRVCSFICACIMLMTKHT